MLKKNKSIILNHLSPKDFKEQSENNLFKNSKISSIFLKNKNNINENKISIPKISSKENKNNYINLIKDNTIINSLEKINKYNYNKYLKKKGSFYFCPKNRELINYFDKKNKNIISNISMINQNKNLNLKKLVIKDHSKLNYDFDKNHEINTSINATRKKKNIINKSSSLPICLKKNMKNITNNFSNSIVNKDNDDNLENKNNLRSNIFNLKNINNNNSNLSINLKKYIEIIKNEKNNINNKLNNNSNDDNDDDLNLNKKINIKSKKHSFEMPNYLLKKKLVQKKKEIDNDTLEIIKKERNRIKSAIESKYMKKEEELKKKYYKKN